VAVFLDGCFWHFCPHCGHVPNVNRPFWKAKMQRNRHRDRKVNQCLKELGIRVVRLWEHELREGAATCVQKLRDVLSAPVA
jgi:DNA mismatch endonuclease (patch repair protein)